MHPTRQAPQHCRPTALSHTLLGTQPEPACWGAAGGAFAFLDKYLPGTSWVPGPVLSPGGSAWCKARKGASPSGKADSESDKQGCVLSLGLCWVLWERSQQGPPSVGSCRISRRGLGTHFHYPRSPLLSQTGSLEVKGVGLSVGPHICPEPKPDCLSICNPSLCICVVQHMVST